MGVRGAAVGTLTSRILELLIVVWYLVKKDEKLRLFDGGIRGILPDRETVWHYACVAAPILLSSVVWSISVPMQTAILGHLSADAIAANSVATTFFQYLKVIVIALSSSSAVIIGKSIGVGNEERIRSDARTLSVIDVTTGAVLGLLLFLLRHPLLSMYNLSDEAMVLADHLIIIMSCVYGRDVLPDAGFQWHYPELRRYEIQHVCEPGVYLVHRDAAVILCCFCVETTCGNGGSGGSVGSVF